MARPTTYEGEKTIRVVEEYLSNRKDRFDEKTNRQTVDLPTIEGLAVFIGCHKDTLYEWAEKNPEFSDALAKVKLEQMERLINKGLAGDYNPTIAKLILSANHGMRERADLTTDDEKLPAVPIYAGKSTTKIPGHPSNAKDISADQKA